MKKVQLNSYLSPVNVPNITCDDYTVAMERTLDAPYETEGNSRRGIELPQIAALQAPSRRGGVLGQGRPSETLMQTNTNTHPPSEEVPATSKED